MSNSKTTQIIISLCLYLFAGLCHAQNVEVRASVDKNPVMVDESFILSVVANGELDRDAFDSSFLMKDFVVGRTSVSSQTKMVNFDTTKSITWSTVLIPKTKGRFTIPSFDLQGNKTQPINIMVIPVSASSAAKGRDLFITTEVDVEQAYLQQQLHYKVKLHLGKDLQRGTLASPTLENADIRQIGKDKEYNELVDGKRYRIIERSFAILPHPSGTFTIDGPLFEGELIDNSRQSFGFFNRSKVVNRVGPSQTVTIKPIPSGYTEHWLPSELVQINDEWQPGENGFIAGEPVTRTITLTALGVVEEQLPELPSLYPTSVKTYPDKAETATLEKDNTLIAQRKESIAIIPNKEGELIIPAVKVPWFNTITQKTEFAVLPAKTLQITPAIEQTPVDIPIPTLIESNANTEEAPQTTSLTSNNLIPTHTTFWQWVCIGLLVIWGITLLFWWVHVRRLSTHSKPPSTSVTRTSESEQKRWKNLEKALGKNDNLVTQKYLALWLACITQNKKASLTQSMIVLKDPELDQSVNELLASRYSSNQTNWNSTSLHKILRRLRKEQHNKQPNKMVLTPLYPTT